ncbi:hypothetical protein C6499_19765 [Candidatus Poribacteria bacterium]|nr:MAG: hypothetical protein C6499_19765 [Candidatus Poribacteria bacterium]
MKKERLEETLRLLSSQLSNASEDCTAIGFLDHTLKEDCATIQPHFLIEGAFNTPFQTVLLV